MPHGNSNAADNIIDEPPQKIIKIHASIVMRQYTSHLQGWGVAVRAASLATTFKSRTPEPYAQLILPLFQPHGINQNNTKSFWLHKKSSSLAMIEFASTYKNSATVLSRERR